jgi:hypothetical protein
MTDSVRRSPAILGALCAPLLGCGSGPATPLPPVVSNSSRVEYRSDSDLSACPDAAALVQSRLEAMEHAFHVTGPSRITYVHYGDQAALTSSGCPVEASGCQSGTEIGSTSFVDFHEIVHATLAPQGRPDAVVLEGAAVAYEHTGSELFTAWPTWQTAVSQGRSYPAPPVTFLFGAAFSAYLVKHYGVDKFMAFYRSSSANASPETFASQFQSVFGATIDAAWADASTIESLSLCDDLTPNMALDGSEAVTDTSCLDKTGVVRHVFELDGDTPLGIETSYAAAFTSACTLTQLPSVWGWEASQKPPWTATLSSWRPGRYYVTPRSPTAQDSFRATAGAFQGLSCGAIVPYTIASPLVELRVQLRPELETWAEVAWNGPDPLVFNLAADTTDLNSGPCDWYACASCDESTCTPISVTPISIQGVGYFHVKDTQAEGETGCSLLLQER